MGGRCGSGIRLPHTYAYHWCAPSRAAFFTGRYVAMHGYEDGGDGPDKGDDGMGTGTSSAVPLHFRLLPQVLQSAGYRTLMIGKWCARSPRDAYAPGSPAHARRTAGISATRRRSTPPKHGASTSTSAI